MSARGSSVLRAVFAACAMTAISGCGAAFPAEPPAAAVGSAPSGQLAHQGKTSGCHVHGLLPDPACTPGSVFTRATAAQVCVRGYSRSVRTVSEQTRLAVYAAYGITPGQGRRYELDHLVALELGGDNSQANLWPEAAPGYRQKDKVEDELHAAVCAGRLGLRTAQQRIARDWLHANV